MDVDGLEELEFPSIIRNLQANDLLIFEVTPGTHPEQIKRMAIHLGEWKTRCGFAAQVLIIDPSEIHLARKTTQAAVETSNASGA